MVDNRTGEKTMLEIIACEWDKRVLHLTLMTEFIS